VHTQVVPSATSVCCPPQDVTFEVVLVEWAAPTAGAELGGTAPVEGPTASTATRGRATRSTRKTQRREQVQMTAVGNWSGDLTSYALRSYLSTAAKQGKNRLEVLQRLFNGDTWMPAAPGASP